MKAKRRQWKRETFAQKSARANNIAARLAGSYPELEFRSVTATLLSC